MSAYTENFDATGFFIRRIRSAQQKVKGLSDRPRLKELAYDIQVEVEACFGWYLQDAMARRHPGMYIPDFYLTEIRQVVADLDEVAVPANITLDMALEALSKHIEPPRKPFAKTLEKN